MVFTDIATKALRILDHPIFEVDLYLMRINCVSPPPQENFVPPQNGNCDTGASRFISCQ